MSLAPLRFIYSKGGEVEIEEIHANRSSFDDDDHYRTQHKLEHDMFDYKREGLIIFIPEAFIGLPPGNFKIRLTERGIKMVELSMEPQLNST